MVDAICHFLNAHENRSRVKCTRNIFRNSDYFTVKGSIDKYQPSAQLVKREILDALETHKQVVCRIGSGRVAETGKLRFHAFLAMFCKTGQTQCDFFFVDANFGDHTATKDDIETLFVGEEIQMNFVDLGSTHRHSTNFEEPDDAYDFFLQNGVTYRKESEKSVGGMCSGLTYVLLMDLLVTSVNGERIKEGHVANMFGDLLDRYNYNGDILNVEDDDHTGSREKIILMAYMLSTLSGLMEMMQDVIDDPERYGMDYRTCKSIQDILKRVLPYKNHDGLKTPKSTFCVKRTWESSAFLATRLVHRPPRAGHLRPI